MRGKETSGEELELVGPSKSLFEKGGSLAVCIPSRIVKYLDLPVFDQLVFMLDKKNKRLLAGKKDSMTIKIGERKVTLYVPVKTRGLGSIARSLNSRQRRGKARHSRSSPLWISLSIYVDYQSRNSVCFPRTPVLSLRRMRWSNLTEEKSLSNLGGMIQLPQELPSKRAFMSTVVLVPRNKSHLRQS